MAHKTFDVSAKELIWDDPEAWLRRFGVPQAGPVEIIDSDITAITAIADKVLKIKGRRSHLVNIELQASHKARLARTLWFRQAALDYRHGLPVQTLLVLLRKEADSPRLTGAYERFLPDGTRTNWYAYQVVRLWREPAESFLEGGPGLVPLAPLSDVQARDLPDLVGRMAQRLDRLPAERAATLWTATYLLMGLRYDEALISRLLEGVHAMKESTTYQKILREGRQEGLDEGRVEEARRLLLRLGTIRFGPPAKTASTRLRRLADLARLERLGERLLDPQVAGWKDLLETD